MPYIPVTIGDVSVDAFIDTGSYLTILSEELRNTIPSLCKQSTSQPYPLGKSVTGDSIDAVGRVTATVSIGSNRLLDEFHVARNVSKPLILRWDFLLRHKASVDIIKGVMTLGNEEVPLLKRQTGAPLCCNLILQNPVTIPPESQVQVKAKLETSPYKMLPDKYDGVIEDRYFDEPSILIPRSLVQVKEGHTIATIVNPTRTPVQVKRNHLIGKVFATHAVENAEYTVLGGVRSRDVTSHDTLKQGIHEANVDEENLTDKRELKFIIFCNHIQMFSVTNQEGQV
ncbi:DNA damage-inducible protein 1 [Holothuria leucospilota]|uniref:DNA damage-inducible protein 1 n=1 Tax=Holothuria leucospilota TaxID=206669 RepID=A0A9Q1H705_HOLLE|nr:DNA damage-inducible protein 1 [Holothuria leucospilota]